MDDDHSLKKMLSHIMIDQNIEQPLVANHTKQFHHQTHIDKQPRPYLSMAFSFEKRHQTLHDGIRLPHLFCADTQSHHLSYESSCPNDKRNATDKSLIKNPHTF